MKQSALLEFESSAFAVEPDEDEHTNPGIFGAAALGGSGATMRALCGRRTVRRTLRLSGNGSIFTIISG